MLFISKKLYFLMFCLVLVSSILFSCSVPTSDTNSASEDLSCTKESCEKVKMSIIVPSGFSVLEDNKYYFVGVQHESNTWEIYSALEDSAGNSVKDRNIKVHIDSYPKKLTVLGQDSSKVTITWTPLSETGKSGDKIKLIVRDVDRCKHENPDNTEDCDNLDKRMKKYEESQTAGFYISEDENLEELAERLAYMEDRKTTDVTGALMKGCLLGLGTGVLTGFLSGGGLIGALKGGVSGCSTNASSMHESLK